MDIQLHLGDCLGENGMRTLQDKSVDMILADLPYNMTLHQWDKALDLEEVFKEYMRVIKDNGAIVLFSCQPFTTDLTIAGRKWFRYELIWSKNYGSDFLSANKKPMKSHENLLVFYKKTPTYNPQMREGKPSCGFKDEGRDETITHMGRKFKRFRKHNPSGMRFPLTVINFKKDQGKHGTQKPVPLLEWLIKTYTNETELVLDNTFGSGSTAVACKNTNRRFVGWEMEQKYFDVAKERLELNDVK